MTVFGALIVVVGVYASTQHEARHWAWIVVVVGLCIALAGGMGAGRRASR